MGWWEEARADTSKPVPPKWPTRKRKKPPPKRATRSLLAGRPSLRLPHVEFEPHHVDILALGLIAVGILLGGVAYGGWNGGTLGNGAVTGMRFLLRRARIRRAGRARGGGRCSCSCVSCGRPPVRCAPGLICLTCSITLALAAGTLGVGPGPVPSAVLLDAGGVRDAGRCARAG